MPGILLDRPYLRALQIENIENLQTAAKLCATFKTLGDKIIPPNPQPPEISFHKPNRL